MNFEIFKKILLSDSDVNKSNVDVVDFSYRIAIESDFTGVDLRQVEFVGANLTTSSFRNANCMNADFTDADLYNVDFSGADLTNANFNKADLRRSNFTGAILEDVNFRSADLSGCTGLVSTKDFLSQFDRTEDNWIICYKLFNCYFDAPSYWNIEVGSIITEECNYNRAQSCGCGINVSNLKYINANYSYRINELWKVAVNPCAGYCVPYCSEGKFRAQEVRLIEQLEYINILT